MPMAAFYPYFYSTWLTTLSAKWAQSRVGKYVEGELGNAPVVINWTEDGEYSGTDCFDGGFPMVGILMQDANDDRLFNLVSIGGPIILRGETGQEDCFMPRTWYDTTAGHFRTAIYPHGPPDDEQETSASAGARAFKVVAIGGNTV